MEEHDGGRVTSFRSEEQRTRSNSPCLWHNPQQLSPAALLSPTTAALLAAAAAAAASCNCWG